MLDESRTISLPGHHREPLRQEILLYIGDGTGDADAYASGAMNGDADDIAALRRHVVRTAELARLLDQIGWDYTAPTESILVSSAAVLDDLAEYVAPQSLRPQLTDASRFVEDRSDTARLFTLAALLRGDQGEVAAMKEAA